MGFVLKIAAFQDFCSTILQKKESGIGDVFKFNSFLPLVCNPGDSLKLSVPVRIFGFLVLVGFGLNFQIFNFG